MITKGSKVIIFKERTRWTIHLANGEKARFKTLKAAKAFIERERAANGTQDQ